MQRAARTLALVVFLAGAAASAAAQDLVITNARVIVGTGQVIDRGSVVVRGGRIASVGASVDASVDSAPAPAGGTTIDARGMTVMPGFIDAHRHIIPGSATESGADEWFKNQAAARMQEFLEAGYTTLMSGGGPVPGIVQLKERVDRGELKGPRIITSGRADPANFKTPAAAREQVRALAKARVEIIKAAISPAAEAWETEVLAAIVDEGRKHTLDVMVHAVSPKATVAAVKAGAQKLVHTPHFGWLTEAEARLIRDAGVEVLSCAGFGVPVFGVFNQNNVPTFRDGKPWPDAILDGQGRGREAGEKIVNARTLWDAGVIYGFGTDTGYHPREGLAHELRTLNVMFSPQDLIKVMGPNTAAFIDKGAELGTLEAGKFADIVMLEGNPLEGYWHLLNPKVVIKGGVVMVDKR